MSLEDLQKIVSPKFTKEVIYDFIVKTSGLSEICVKKIKIGASSKKGDSYLSNICRFTIDVTGKNKEGKEEPIFIPVIVKFLPKNIARCKTYRSADFFENEVIFYKKETYYSERIRPWFTEFQKRVFVVIRDAVEKELPPEYLQKLDNIINGDFYGLLIRSSHVRGPLSVVTHGDVWVLNFLIQHQGDHFAKIAMIDFQLARYTTLVADLVFFIYSCVNMDLVEQKFDDLIAEYHKALSTELESFGANKKVTLEDLHKELKEHSIMGVGMSMEALIMTQLEDEDVSDLGAIQGQEAVPLESVWLIYPFKEQEKRQRIAKMIKIASDKNFI